MISRRELLKCAAASAAAALGGRLFASDPKRKPNIVFILADDLGYGDLGCFGQKEIKTPRLDRMAAEGIRFTRHYSGNTVCAPSRCALMTGKHAGHAAILLNSGGPLPESEVTIAELLRQAGYATGLIGKWGLGGTDTPGHPNRQGFDSFFGYLSQTHAHNYYPSHLYRNEERVELPNQVPNEGRAGTGWATTRIAYSHDLFARESLEFVERHRHEPFFLYLAFTIPHANNEAGRLGKNGMEVPDFGEYAERDWPAPQKGLAAMITRMDADIGRLLDKIDDLGLGENTLVLFSSDNGPHKEGGNNPQFFHSSGPLRGIKRDLFEGGIRVPTIARMPGTVAAGTVSDHPSAFWDFLPTACEAAGIEAPSGLDGISYWPALTGRGVQAAHDYLYWEIPEVGGRQAIQQGDWKAIRHNASANPDGPVQLYNLAEDPGEERDLAERFPDLAHSLAQRMIEARGGKPFPKQGSRGRARSSAG